MLPEIRTILYATDLAPNAAAVFRYALSLAHQYGAKIEMLHAVEPLDAYARSLVRMYSPETAGEGVPAATRQRIIDELHQRLDRFYREELCPDSEDRNRVSGIQVVEGRAAQVILKETERLKADIVVLGARGHTLMGEVLLGSVAHRVMQHSKVPVLLVRHPEEG